MSIVRKLVLISGFIPVIALLPAIFQQKVDPLPLVYSLFIFTYLLKNKIKPSIENIPLPTLLKFYLLATFLGMLTDSLVFISDRSGAIGHQDNIFLNFLLSSGWYSAFTLAWTIVLKKYRFTLKQVFLAQGILGLFIEQQGSVIVSMVQNPLAIIWGIYSIVIYAPFIAIPFTLLEDKLQSDAKSDSPMKYFLLPIVVAILILALVSFDSIIKNLL